ncbi:glycosyltransferase family 4 protein [Streptomyces sp. TLI_171]|uniref:glycosyltransferase family 4 protein n=1 Tax=Streptomyces sp. TLI_171 TaxID=1938859 RepID=UPI000C187F34|nr:glycosyltransferase family 4 protein [Streptomyces sp. TLI_171]RKE23498.1 D-inositol-3-phosphate glycosyltransferase [Streptomyces sp. TLI_171]
MARETCSPSDPARAAAAQRDVVAECRRHWWDPGAPLPAGDDLLSVLARAEYGHGAARRAADGLGADDRSAAALRRAARLGAPGSPYGLVTAAGGPAAVRSALAEAWAESVAAGHRDRATAALRSRLVLPLPAAEAGCLLDLADSHRLRPLSAAECAARARSGDPQERHAALRYLSGVPDGWRVLPARPFAAADPYEQILLSAAWERADPGSAVGARFRRAVRGLPSRPATGLVVAQSMLTGRLREPGAGLSGGMSVLVAGLGAAMAATADVARVLTVVLMDVAELRHGQPLVEQLGTGHWVVKIPVYGGDPVDPASAPHHRPSVAWWAARLLGLPGAGPDVVHARFADDSSLALADAARRCGSRFVYTVTPDPHRVMADRHRGVPPAAHGEPASALRLDLHRIFLGDRLVDRADLLLAIPGRPGGPELSAHFPVLAGDGAPRLVSHPEGIPAFTPRSGDERDARALIRRLFRGGEHPDGLDPAARRMRLILSVGRLHPVKQQDRLVEAWLDSGLYRVTTLLLVGGSPAVASTPVEREMRDAIDKLLADRPDARRHLARWPALPNRQIRVLESALASGRWTGRAVYVCPSAKEEFGLAVLEAMDSGLPAAGPRRGGVPHYVRHGVNGFLLSTDSTPALAEGLAAVLGEQDGELGRIALEGRRSVGARFSASAMAEALVAEYRKLTDAVPRRRRNGGSAPPPYPRG